MQTPCVGGSAAGHADHHAMYRTLGMFAAMEAASSLATALHECVDWRALAHKLRTWCRRFARFLAFKLAALLRVAWGAASKWARATLGSGFAEQTASSVTTGAAPCEQPPPTLPPPIRLRLQDPVQQGEEDADGHTVLQASHDTSPCTACRLEDAVNPCRTNCGHTYCYVCLHAALIHDPEFECVVCAEPVSSVTALT
ncbi:hypothetical protein EON66_07615 [archaeon]|nr:MAG: hypothetical protein EON66_07615 [archaeon]